MLKEAAHAPEDRNTTEAGQTVWKLRTKIQFGQEKASMWKLEESATLIDDRELLGQQQLYINCGL